MSDLESFIPLRRHDVVDLCARDSRDAEGFRDFGRLLLALVHHDSLDTLNALKDAYAEFNPDRDTVRIDRASDAAALADVLARRFDDILMAAHYRRLSTDDLKQALGKASIIPLNTRVELDDYQDFAFYYRGATRETIHVRRFLFKTRAIAVENLERVAVLLRFKDPVDREDRRKRRQMRDIDFQPGKIYLYLYKNVPRTDLELLFPNVEVSMTWRDKLLFVLPAAASAGPLLIKVLPSLGLIVGVILLLTMGPDVVHWLHVNPSEQRALYPLMVAVLSTSFALGGFAVRQYLNYKNKKLKFQKRVTDTLFFKNLVTNRGVLFTIVDSAEEELSKEMVLAYHHLCRAAKPLTRRDLDQRVEAWLREHCGRAVDFDVGTALERLASFQRDGRAVITRQGDHWSALPLPEAKAVLDAHWDALYDYAGTTAAPAR